MFVEVFLYSSGEALFSKDMGIGVDYCTYVAKYSCLVLYFSLHRDGILACLVMVKLGVEPSNLTGGGGYRRRRRGRPLGWPMYNLFYVFTHFDQYFDHYFDQYSGQYFDQYFD